MKMKELFLLKNDYDSSDTPIFSDAKTLETLSSLAVKIYNGEYTEDDFHKFVTENLGNGEFAHKCRDFVSYSILFLNHSKSKSYEKEHS